MAPIKTYPSLQFLRLGPSDLCNKEMESTDVPDDPTTAKVEGCSHSCEQ
jgi:hypothetical protein